MKFMNEERNLLSDRTTTQHGVFKNVRKSTTSTKEYQTKTFLSMAIYERKIFGILFKYKLKIVSRVTVARQFLINYVFKKVS